MFMYIDHRNTEVKFNHIDVQIFNHDFIFLNNSFFNKITSKLFSTNNN